MTTYATLCFLVRDGQVLLLRKAEGLWGGGKWNGPGGKLLPGEDREETGLRPQDLAFAGLLRFAFGAGPPGWVVYVFRAGTFTGTPRDGREGVLRWHRVDALPLDEMWEDDRHWLPLFLGVILGECILGSVWTIIGITFDMPTYAFWP